ncbi:hypothetical protein KIN20_023530 [Parelaphostrongylus tenuis]|uniref:Uncharacterized protein n=1 Tax=Parelaphostrongylus tenuis TaxID=148309 RepID=A0AAD5N784_PARTN|nr:hypothetical protein KIN20_023530 [Parelaphostrongylus tenuis]
MSRNGVHTGNVPASGRITEIGWRGIWTETILDTNPLKHCRLGPTARRRVRNDGATIWNKLEMQDTLKLPLDVQLMAEFDILEPKVCDDRD